MRRMICIFLCLFLLGGTMMISALAEEDSVQPAAAEEAEAEADTAEVNAADASVDDPQYWVVNHANPYASAASLAATGYSHSDFTTRALNNETLCLGIDVSVFQGTIDWSAVASDGIQFVFIRGGYRGVSTGSLNKDSSFVTNITGALAAGLEVGVYIYSQAITVEEAEEEAQFLIDLVSGYNITLPLVIDYEYYNNSSGSLAGRLYTADLTRQEATDICNAFCDTVEAAGYDGMVYANLSMLNSHLYAGQLGRVWLAHFTTSTSYTGDYEYWQCTASGAVSGISNLVDLDFWFKPGGGTVTESTPTPTAEETPDPSETPVPTDTPEATSTPEPTEVPEATSTPEPTESPEATYAPDPAVTPTPTDNGEISNPFTDVEESDWFYDVVMGAYGEGVVNGMTTTTFSPNASATRGQVITMIYRMAGQPETSGISSFTDLTQTYYMDAVAWAEENMITNGISSLLFAPDYYVSRQDLITMLYRLVGSPSVTTSLSVFSDVGDVQSYAQDAMAWAVETGIVRGYEDNTLRPANYATRAEVCAILIRYLGM